MVKKAVWCVLLIGFSFAFLSCKYITYTQVGKSVAVRTIVETVSTEALYIQVFLENNEGLFVDGAMVQVKTRGSALTRVPFDADEHCYASTVASSNEGGIEIIIQSSLLEEDMLFTVPYETIPQSASITVLQDALGNSMLQGDSLQGSEEIQIGWNVVDEGVFYVVHIKTALETVYSVSTESSQIIVPANTLESGQNYFMQIIAQKIFGDPLFKNENYYSVSTNEGSNMSFTVE